MPKTTVSDVVFGTQFLPYMNQWAITTNRFVRSGVIDTDPFWNKYASGAGREVDLPFWKPLEGVRQIMSDSTPVTVNRITAGKDIAWIHNDHNAWSVNGLATLMAGEDPMRAIVAQLGNFWAGLDERMLIACLKGMFDAAPMAANVLDVRAATGGSGEANYLTGACFVDATARLGDRSDLLTAIAMHSATEAYLRKLNLIDTIPASEGLPCIKLFQGREVIIDDSLPVFGPKGDSTAKSFTSYLFGKGAFVRGTADLNGMPLEGGHGTQGLEMARKPEEGDTLLINRRRYILHPRGVRFSKEDLTTQSPTDEDLAAPENWSPVYELKNIRLVAIHHNVPGYVN